MIYISMFLLIHLQTTLEPAFQKSDGRLVFGILKEDDNEIMLYHMEGLATLLRCETVQVRLTRVYPNPLFTTKWSPAHKVLRSLLQISFWGSYFFRVYTHICGLKITLKPIWSSLCGFSRFLKRTKTPSASRKLHVEVMGMPWALPPVEPGFEPLFCHLLI